MAGDAEASRVGDALAVDEQNVRLNGEGLQHRGQGGGFPKGEEAGNVWEWHFRRCNSAFDDFEVGITQDYYGGSRTSIGIDT